MKTATRKHVWHIIGLDLAQPTAPSALCVLERTWEESTPITPAVYDCRDLRRWPLGTPYPDIVRDVVKLTRNPRLVDTTLAVDQTGVGRAVVDMFREKVRCPLTPINITAGNS